MGRVSYSGVIQDTKTFSLICASVSETRGLLDTKTIADRLNSELKKKLSLIFQREIIAEVLEGFLLKSCGKLTSHVEHLFNIKKHLPCSYH